MRATLGCLLMALAVNAAAADDKDDKKIDAKLLPGRWGYKEKKESGLAMIEFTKDGMVVLSGTKGGKEAKLEGTYKLDGNKLTTTMKVGEMEQSRTLTITKLTETELEGTDEDGKKSALVRIKEKK